MSQNKTSVAVLRLDDGSLIGPSFLLDGTAADPLAVVKLPVRAALLADRVGHKDLDRLKRILCATRQLMRQQKEELGMTLKVGRLAGGSQVTCEWLVASDVHDDAQEDRASTREEPDFVKKCLEVLAKVYNVLGAGYKDVFYRPVDVSLVPDYHIVVKTPMTLQQIETKLCENTYAHAHEFYTDMSLVWSNCKLYNNRKGDPFRKLGERTAAFFEEAWAEAGLSNAMIASRPADAADAADAAAKPPKLTVVAMAPSNKFDRQAVIDKICEVSEMEDHMEGVFACLLPMFLD